MRYVINFQTPTTITSYVHRIGRCARIGVGGETQPGTSISFLHSTHDKKMAVTLVKNLMLSGQTVPPDLETLAQSHFSYNQVKTPNKNM